MISGSALLTSGVFAVLSVILVISTVQGRHFPLDAYLYRIWLVFLFITVASAVSFPIGIWILAIICFTALREYFSLIDIRLQDRLGIFGGYLVIPFMIYYIQTGWYNMFIITVPVYGFLAVPLLVTLGGRDTRGTIFSVGSIMFGLFLFVYCLGHIGYLARFSTGMAVLLMLSIATCDVIVYAADKSLRRMFAHPGVRFFLPVPLTIVICLLVSPWAGIAALHAVVLGCLIPVLVMMGHHTIDYVKADLGIDDDALLPGRGEILDTMKSLFYAAPIVFHYYKYFCT